MSGGLVIECFIEILVDLYFREHELRLFELFFVPFAGQLDLFLLLGDPLLNLFSLDVICARGEFLRLESL